MAELASVWITHHSPLGAAATCRSWANVSAGTFAVPVGSWRVDETYVRVGGVWTCIARLILKVTPPTHALG
jgi:transposase-like protein